MRQLLPPWMPTIGIEGGRINIVPVDFVVAALDHISHLKPASTSAASTSSIPIGYRVGDVLEHLRQGGARAEDERCSSTRALLGFIPKSVKKGLMALAPVRAHQGARC